MNSKLKAYAENTLFALNIFILFLLIFESKITIPNWLQPVGRMHPMLLHFPIVILLLAMALEFFRFTTQFQTQELYQDFTTGLWLVGILSSAVTILMGLFLGKEGGYEGATLQWHKWLGVGMLFFTSAIYWCRNAGWYSARTAQAGALVTVFSLIFVGHYGATLTHGENFVLEPITPQAPQVPLEQALVFDHVIQPILEKKCVSCHNPDKIKGKLILSDAESMLKGGKTGKLWVPGKPEMSLLLKRIHLPLDDKKHMPPKGKVQLTEEEARLLALWIRADASFTQKVVELPASDSLRLLAATMLKPADSQQESYDFAAADEQAIARLNNNYRVVAPLAVGSPALAVNFYSKKQFTSQALAELKEVKEQIVSLDLNKMPVQDADLKTISQFENLRRLNLNFTDISGQGLRELAALKHLESLSLSGTQVNYRNLQGPMAALKGLKTVTIWDTKVVPAEIKHLQQAYRHIEFISGFSGEGSEPIQLNPPQIKNSPVFRQTMPLLLHHPIRGVVIRYTTDGSEPDSIHSPVFKPGTVLGTTTTVKARAYKDGWLGSQVAVFPFYRSAYKPDTLWLAHPLNRVHQASGARTFFDGELGAHNANSPAWANNWAGSFNHPMELISEFKQPVQLSAVALNTLIETENFIFPPEKVEVWGGPSKDQLKLIHTFTPAQPHKVAKPVIQLVESKFKPQQVTCVKIIAHPVKALPEWHPRKGSKALLLVDEMFLN
jgi:uncharacterized membrane protein